MIRIDVEAPLARFLLKVDLALDERATAHAVGEEDHLGTTGQRGPRITPAGRTLVVVEHRDAHHASAKCGRVTVDGYCRSWWTKWSAARIIVALACGSPVPMLRAYTGCAPPDTWTRSR